MFRGPKLEVECRLEYFTEDRLVIVDVSGHDRDFLAALLRVWRKRERDDSRESEERRRLLTFMFGFMIHSPPSSSLLVIESIFLESIFLGVV